MCSCPDQTTVVMYWYCSVFPCFQGLTAARRRCMARHWFWVRLQWSKQQQAPVLPVWRMSQQWPPSVIFIERARSPNLEETVSKPQLLQCWTELINSGGQLEQNSLRTFHKERIKKLTSRLSTTTMIDTVRPRPRTSRLALSVYVVFTNY